MKINHKSIKELKTDLVIANGQLARLKNREDILWERYQKAERNFDDAAQKVSGYESYIRALKTKISKRKK